MAVSISMKTGGNMSYDMHSCHKEVWTVVLDREKVVVYVAE